MPQNIKKGKPTQKNVPRDAARLFLDTKANKNIQNISTTI
jgi:hypothetical protein